MTPPLRVTVWNEFRHERQDSRVAKLYPEGIHGAIASALRDEGPAGPIVRTATLDEPENGLPQTLLDDTEVLLWWGHLAHDEVADETVSRVQA
ncbi:MAG TPA: trehalose utilization protein ThuA, partial [Trueperaceae bacterium]